MAAVETLRPHTTNQSYPVSVNFENGSLRTERRNASSSRSVVLLRRLHPELILFLLLIFTIPGPSRV
jgi:hypothetical protein